MVKVCGGAATTRSPRPRMEMLATQCPRLRRLSGRAAALSFGLTMFGGRLAHLPGPWYPRGDSPLGWRAPGPRSPPQQQAFAPQGGSSLNRCAPCATHAPTPPRPRTSCAPHNRPARFARNMRPTISPRPPRAPQPPNSPRNRPARLARNMRPTISPRAPRAPQPPNAPHALDASCATHAPPAPARLLRPDAPDASFPRPDAPTPPGRAISVIVGRWGCRSGVLVVIVGRLGRYVTLRALNDAVGPVSLNQSCPRDTCCWARGLQLCLRPCPSP
jgi:hypothetical protein